MLWYVPLLRISVLSQLMGPVGEYYWETIRENQVVSVRRKDRRGVHRILCLGHGIHQYSPSLRSSRSFQCTFSPHPSYPLIRYGVDLDYQFWPYAVTTALSAVLEAMSDQNDNLILPMFGWAVGSLLGV